MKINIITVLNTVNYGSALQTLATQKFFEELGFEVEFVDYWRKDQTVKGQIKFIIKDKRKTLLQWLKKPVRDLVSIISVFNTNRKFRGFIKENIHITPQTYGSIEELQDKPPEADIYCTGSDQMWNSGWNQGIEKSFFLAYAPENKKKIAFATSIGRTSVDPEELDIIIPMIKTYDFITMREQSAVNLLQDCGVKAEAVLDPTLLFDREQWGRYLRGQKREKPYLLVYQLHLTHAEADFDEAVNRIANERGLEIVRITYSYADLKRGTKIYCPHVFEFLSLIYHADYIVTDSFHGTAFSINFNREFSVLYPDKYSTRMDNILAFAGMQNRRYIGESEHTEIQEKICYEAVNKSLQEKREAIKQMFQTYFEQMSCL